MKNTEELTVRNDNLPAEIEELSRFALIGREKLVSVRAEIRAINKVGLAKEVHDQKLHEAQEIAEAVLDAETKIGELLASIPKQQGRISISAESNSTPKQQAQQSIGISRQQSQRFQTLAAHPDMVAAAKAEAKENGEIVTRQAVIKKVMAISKQPDKKAEVRTAVKEHETFKQAVSDGDVVSISDISKDNENKATITQAFVDEIKFARHTMLSIMAEKPDKMTASLINAMTEQQANDAKRFLDDIISAAMRLTEKIREVHE